MDWILNIGFPILPSTVPTWANSIAVWALLIDGALDFIKFSGSSFKMKTYKKEDTFIVMAIDCSILVLLIELGWNFFSIEMLGSIRMYAVDITFIFVMASLINAIMLSKSKFDYSKIIRSEENYEDVMSKIKSARGVGAITLAIYCALFRIYLMFLPDAGMIPTCIIVITAMVTKWQYNKVSNILNKYLRRNEKETKQRKEQTENIERTSESQQN